jgi:hypothetical protein
MEWLPRITGGSPVAAATPVGSFRTTPRSASGEDQPHAAAAPSTPEVAAFDGQTCVVVMVTDDGCVAAAELGTSNTAAVKHARSKRNPSSAPPIAEEDRLVDQLGESRNPKCSMAVFRGAPSPRLGR